VSTHAFLRDVPPKNRVHDREREKSRRGERDMLSSWGEVWQDISLLWRGNTVTQGWHLYHSRWQWLNTSQKAQRAKGITDPCYFHHLCPDLHKGLSQPSPWL